VEAPIHQRLGYICRNPLGQLGSGRWRAYIVAWGVMIWGVGREQQWQCRVNEVAVHRKLDAEGTKGRAASEGNLNEGTLSEEDMWPCTMRVVG
jgi:hypothetical protein